MGRIALAGLMLVGACTSSPAPPAPARTTLSASLETSAKTDFLFDDMAPPRHFHLNVAETDWQWLNANATQEEYVPASVDFEGQTFDDAAVRYKGGFGSLYSCFDADGNRTCKKLSLKVSFNETDKKGRFYGVRKLIFNSCNRDDTCLRERLSYALFRGVGLVAPRAVHALVSVNDEPESLYLLVESVDKELLEERFEDPEGNLFKEAWPVATHPDAYKPALVTNEETGDGGRLAELAKVLQTVTDATFDGAIAPFIDREAMTRYLVTDQMTHNWDGVWKFYCNGQNQCGNHNFYVYDDPAGRLTVIPWDLDHTYSYPNVDMARSWWDDGPNACDVQQANALAGVKAPQCDPLLRGSMLLHWDEYLATLAALTKDGAPLGVDTQQALLDRYRAMILPAVESDPLGPAPAAWRIATAQLREIIAAQHEEAEALKSFVPPDFP